MGHLLDLVAQPWRHQQTAQKQAGHEGLTLPELLISVVILGLLGAISLPNYMNSIKATRQKDVAPHLPKLIHTVRGVGFMVRQEA